MIVKDLTAGIRGQKKDPAFNAIADQFAEILRVINGKLDGQNVSQMVNLGKIALHSIYFETPNVPMEKLRWVRGTVNSNGTIAQGTGFTPVRNGLGEYTVTFQTAFAQIPTVLLSSGGTGNHANLWGYTPTTTSFGIHASNNIDTADVDTAWSFLAIGEG